MFTSVRNTGELVNPLRTGFSLHQSIYQLSQCAPASSIMHPWYHIINGGRLRALFPLCIVTVQTTLPPSPHVSHFSLVLLSPGFSLHHPVDNCHSVVLLHVCRQSVWARGCDAACTQLKVVSMKLLTSFNWVQPASLPAQLSQCAPTFSILHRWRWSVGGSFPLCMTCHTADTFPSLTPSPSSRSHTVPYTLTPPKNRCAASSTPSTASWRALPAPTTAAASRSPLTAPCAR